MLVAALDRLLASVGLCRFARLTDAHDTADRIIQSVQAWVSSQDDDLTILICDYVR